MKIVFILLLAVMFSLNTMAQPVADSKPANAVKLDDIEVKDSAGTIYPKAVWNQLMMTGKYNIKLSPDRKTALLYRLTDEESAKMFAKMPKPRESNFFKAGEKIASFSDRDIKGNKYNLNDLAGKVVVLNFWFINCGPCRQEMPELNEVVEQFKDNKDVVFIAVALDEKWQIQDFLKTTPFNYNIIGGGRYIAGKYNINTFPTHVVLDKQGKVIFHTTGLARNTVRWVKKSIEAGLNDTIPQ